MNCLAYNDGRSRKVCTFVAPYGYVNETVSETTVAQYADYFKDNEMTCLFFDCTPEGSEQLLASGSASKAFLVFVLERKEAKLQGKVHIFEFKKVLFPDKSKTKSVTLMNGVSVKGALGWIPSKCLTQAYCRCAAVSFKADDNEANPFSYIFKAHQTKDGNMQWRVTTTPGVGNVGFPVPEHFSVWDGDCTTLTIEDGELCDFDVMFKFEDNWYHLVVLKFYQPAVRTNKKPYNYEVKFMDGSRHRMDILFDLEKYCTDAGAVVASWCIIKED